MHILCLQCKDQRGIVAAVAGALTDHECNIEESAQFHDPLSGRFFMRVVYDGAAAQSRAFADDFTAIADRFAMAYDIHDAARPLKTLVLVSKPDHCLNDLLYRWRTRTLPIEITAVAANHDDNRALVETHGLPFHHLPVTPDAKAAQERQIAALAGETGTELIVLARYMQILSADFCARHDGQIINIHHSFLPGFKGARPYHQAYERGVKIIGATAHFATPDLDEGPIIAQNTVPAGHADTPDKLVRTGQDIETRVLARAVRLYAERRIFVQDGRTVIL